MYFLRLYLYDISINTFFNINLIFSFSGFYYLMYILFDKKNKNFLNIYINIFKLINIQCQILLHLALKIKQIKIQSVRQFPNIFL